MQISGIKNNFTNFKTRPSIKKIKTNNNKPNSNIIINSKKIPIILAAMSACLLSGCALKPQNNNSANNVDNHNYSISESYNDSNINSDNTQETLPNTDKDISSQTTRRSLKNDSFYENSRISEIYLPGTPKELIIHPDENLPHNENGSIIITGRKNKLAPYSKEYELTEATNLRNLIIKCYNNDIQNYINQDKDNVNERFEFINNKILSEILQANPYIADKVNKQVSKNESISNNDLLNLPLCETDDEIVLLTLPAEIIVQEPDDSEKSVNSEEINYDLKTYLPKENSAIISTEDGFGYKNIQDAIYDNYGKDISDEAYRDILFSIADDYRNSYFFEYNLDDMNFYELSSIKNITDANRTQFLKFPDEYPFCLLALPTVSTISSNTQKEVSETDKNGIIYDINPSYQKVKMADNGNNKLIDVLQYYHSSDGKGAIAILDSNKERIINPQIKNSNILASHIIQQIILSNLPVFTASYEDETGFHEYGVFDVDEGYKFQSQDDLDANELLNHSHINLERAFNYNFVGKNNENKFKENISLNLPKFSYRINSME